MIQSKKVLLIAGQHRAGTSLLTGVLQDCGAYLGSDIIMESDKFNECGYFENRPIYKFNIKVMRDNRLSWDIQSPVDGDFWTAKKINKNVQELKIIISYELQKAPYLLVIKDPRISILLPIYKQALIELGLSVNVIFAERRADEICDSLKRRNNFSSTKTLNIINAHKQSFFNYCNDINFIWFSVFDCFNYKPEKALSFIKSRFNINNLDFSQACKLFNNKLIHHQSKRNCKIISTFFGRRRNKIAIINGRRKSRSHGFVETKELLSNLIKLEMDLDKGVFSDVIIVNHEFVNDCRESKKFLDSLDGLPIKGGVVKVVSREWGNGVGGSFKSFDFAFKKFKNDYDYWLFTEDNVIFKKPNYFGRAIEQLKESDLIFIACMRVSPIVDHAHGGCGCVHRNHLLEILDKFGSLPYSPIEMSDAMIEKIIAEEYNFQSDEEGHKWYKSFEQLGEIQFTKVFLDLGYKIGEIDLTDKIINYYGREF